MIRVHIICVIPPHLEKINLIFTLGGFGIVMEAEKKVMNKKRAVKRVRLPVDVEERQNIFRGELNCFAQLEHKNIVRFYHSWIELPPIGWLGGKIRSSP